MSTVPHAASTSGPITWLILLGASLQAGGFLLVLYLSITTRRRRHLRARSLPARGVSAVQRSAKALIALVSRLWRRAVVWRRRTLYRMLVRLGLRRPSPPQPPIPGHRVVTTAGAGTSATGFGSIGEVDRRLGLLEFEVGRLKTQRGEDRAQLDNLITETRSEREAEEAHRTWSLLWEEVGVFIFLAGVVATTLGTVL